MIYEVLTEGVGRLGEPEHLCQFLFHGEPVKDDDVTINDTEYIITRRRWNKDGTLAIIVRDKNSSIVLA